MLKLGARRAVPWIAPLVLVGVSLLLFSRATRAPEYPRGDQPTPNQGRLSLPIRVGASPADSSVAVTLHYTEGGRLTISARADDAANLRLFVMLPGGLRPQVEFASKTSTWSHEAVDVAQTGDCDVDAQPLCVDHRSEHLLLSAGATALESGYVADVQVSTAWLESSANGHHYIRSIGVTCLNEASRQQLGSPDLASVGCLGGSSRILMSMNAANGGDGATLTRVSPGSTVFDTSRPASEADSPFKWDTEIALSRIFEYRNPREAAGSNGLLLIAGALIGVAAAELLAMVKVLRLQVGGQTVRAWPEEPHGPP